jgi:predicted transcriptional regulator
VSPVKEEAKRLIDELPENATWEQLVETLELQRAVQEGVDDLDAGRVLSHEEVRRRLLGE